MKIITQNNEFEFRSSILREKAWVRLAQSNGHWYLQFHDAKGLFTSYIHYSLNGAIQNEDGLYMPKYVYPLIKAANDYLNQYLGDN